ncbi:hypothetical protein HGRIS_006558 [Hohenbuehelia grisea]|uniref:ATPase AAA-type core domain-containing protein n=1 Tax=Hohenbuehelia grisea TaxID=104357 RepID=A0ABR3J9Y4_9AGAR
MFLREPRVLDHPVPDTLLLLSKQIFSAEATSEHVKRPLYVLGGGDLGTKASELDAALERIFDVATAWKAIVLIDEADLFLEQRSLHDLKRNVMVAVFLCHVKYYRGILFLTTNRVKAFDEAFLSRIHVALHFHELSLESKTQVWKAFMAKAGAKRSVEELEELAKRDVNGAGLVRGCAGSHAHVVGTRNQPAPILRNKQHEYVADDEDDDDAVSHLDPDEEVEAYEMVIESGIAKEEDENALDELHTMASNDKPVEEDDLLLSQNIGGLLDNEWAPDFNEDEGSEDAIALVARHLEGISLSMAPKPRNGTSLFGKPEESEDEEQSRSSTAADSEESSEEYEIEDILESTVDDKSPQPDGAAGIFGAMEGIYNAKAAIKRFWKRENESGTGQNDKATKDARSTLIDLDFLDLCYNTQAKTLICTKCPTALSYRSVHCHFSTPIVKVAIALPTVLHRTVLQEVVHDLRQTSPTFYTNLKTVLAEHGINPTYIVNTQSVDEWHRSFATLYPLYPATIPPIDGLRIYPAVRCKYCSRCYISKENYSRHFVKTSSGSKICGQSPEGLPFQKALNAVNRENIRVHHRVIDFAMGAGRKNEKAKAKDEDEDDPPDSGLAKYDSIPDGVPVLAQSFSRTNALQLYFAVEAKLTELGSTPGETRSSWKEKLQAHRTRLLEYAIQAQDSVKKDSFIETEGISKFLEPFETAQVHNACHTPLRGGYSSHRLRRRLVSLREEGAQTDTLLVQSFHPSVRFLFKVCSPQTRPGTDWKANIGPTTLGIYCTVQEMLICALAKHISKPILSRDGTKTLFALTPVQERCARDLIASLHIDRSTPLSMQERHNALPKMYKLLYQIYFPPPTTKFLRQSFASPLIAFLATMWLKKDGSYLEIQELTPYLAKVQFMMRLAGFHKIYESFQAVEEEEIAGALLDGDRLGSKHRRNLNGSSSSEAPSDDSSIVSNDSGESKHTLENPLVDDDFLLENTMKDSRPRRKNLSDMSKSSNQRAKLAHKGGSCESCLSTLLRVLETDEAACSFAKAYTGTYLREFMPTPFATLQSWMHIGTHIANNTNRRPVIVVTDDAGGTIQAGSATFTLDEFFQATKHKIALLLRLVSKISMGINLAELGIQYDPHSIQDTMDEKTPESFTRPQSIEAIIINPMVKEETFGRGTPTSKQKQPKRSKPRRAQSSRAPDAPFKPKQELSNATATETELPKVRRSARTRKVREMD